MVKRQQGKCVQCGLYFKDGDQVEIDHYISISLRGTDLYVNVQLLHRHCHNQKTATDGSVVARRDTDDNSQIVEEPDEMTSFTSSFEAERRGATSSLRLTILHPLLTSHPNSTRDKARYIIYNGLTYYQ
jgi:RNA-directed DNA polymerase